MKTKPKICSHRGCKKKLRSNSIGDTCYDHRQDTLSTVKEIQRQNEIGPRGGKKRTKKKSSFSKPHKAGSYQGKFHNILRSVDVVFLIIDPAGRDCEMKFVFLKTVDVSAFKFFKALTNMKGMSNVAVSMAGLMTISASRPLHLTDINHGMKKFIPEINRFFPDVKDVDFKESPPIYEVGDRGFKKSEKKLMP